MFRDQIVRGLLQEPDLRVLIAHTTGVSRHAAKIHGCERTAALVLAQTITGAALLAGLGKDDQRITLQLQGQGPLRGLFAEGAADGSLRAYVQSERVNFPGRDPSDLSYSLGPEGTLSVLRELPSGEFYRGAIALDERRLDRNLERFFEVSDQVPTAVAIEVLPGSDEQPSRAVGLLVQRLPGGDAQTLSRIAGLLHGGALRGALDEGDGGGMLLATKILQGFGELDVVEDIPLAYRCTCSRERAERGVIAAGQDEILEMIARDRGAELSCEFCKTTYRFTAEELMALLDSLLPPEGGNAS